MSDVEAGHVALLGHTQVLGAPPDWRQRDVAQLWHFHLHYWDWAWGLAQERDRLRARAVFRRLLTSWATQSRFGRGDEWSPYVVALRAWTWCGLYEELVRGSDVDDQFVSLLGLHAGFLKAHLELDVGGNHLIKNLKALVGLGIFFRDGPMRERGMRRLEREIHRQILPDGGHFERAPAYHCQVLSDLIDVKELLGDASPRWLSQAIERMRRWLGFVLLPDGSVPLLNDGYPVSATVLEALKPGSPAPTGLTLMPNSGLAVMRRGDLYVLADVGLPCPDDLPAHAHADTLGFLWYAGTQKLVGECGTSTYERGDVRDFERGTAAHSTVQVDEADSTEVWGAFRAARRARPTLLRAEDDGAAIVVSASHDGYRRLSGSPVHTRTWTLTDSSLRVVDDILGEGNHLLAVRLHGTPQEVVRRASANFLERRTQVAFDWNRREPSTCLEHVTRERLPWHFEVELAVKETT